MNNCDIDNHWNGLVDWASRQLNFRNFHACALSIVQKQGDMIEG